MLQKNVKSYNDDPPLAVWFLCMVSAVMLPLNAVFAEEYDSSKQVANVIKIKSVEGVDTAIGEKIVKQPLPRTQKDLKAFLAPKFLIEHSKLASQNISGNDGKVALDITQLSITNVLGGVSFENYNFTWKNISALPFGDKVNPPISQIQRIKVFGRVPYPINEQNMLLVGLSASSTYEQKTDDSYSYDVFGLLSHDMVKNDSVQIGAYVKYHPVQTVALPIIEYTFNLRSPDNQSGYYGNLGFPKTKIGYHLNAKWKADFQAIYRQAIAKLSDNSTISADGYSQIKSWRGEMAFYYSATKNLEIKSAIKYTLTRDWYVYDKNYQQTAHYFINNTAGLGLGLVYTFK